MKATQKKILAAAIAVFSRKGFHQATMDDIAGAAGVAKGTLYYNYDSKSALFSAAITDGIDELDYNGPVVKRTPHRAGVMKVAGSTDGLSARDARIFATAVLQVKYRIPHLRLIIVSGGCIDVDAPPRSGGRCLIPPDANFAVRHILDRVIIRTGFRYVQTAG